MGGFAIEIVLAATRRRNVMVLKILPRRRNLFGNKIEFVIR